jgi:hypothetical protein
VFFPKPGEMPLTGSMTGIIEILWLCKFKDLRQSFCWQLAVGSWQLAVDSDDGVILHCF